MVVQVVKASLGRMKEKSLKLRAAILLAIWSALADDFRTFLLGAHILELGHNPEFLRAVSPAASKPVGRGEDKVSFSSDGFWQRIVEPIPYTPDPRVYG